MGIEELKARLNAKKDAERRAAELDSVKQVFEAGDEAAREEAIRQLVGIGGRDALDVLAEKGLADPDTHIRTVALRALSSWRPESWLPSRDQRLHEPNDATSLESLMTIVGTESAADWVRADAMRCIGRSSHPRVMEYLTDFARDVDETWIPPGVSEELLAILKRTSALEVLLLLLEALRTAKWDPMTGRHFADVVKALQSSGDPELTLLSSRLDGFPEIARTIVSNILDEETKRRRELESRKELKRTIDAIMARGPTHTVKSERVVQALSDFYDAVGPEFIGQHLREGRTRIGFCDCGYPTKFLETDGSWGPIFGLVRMELDGRDWQNYLCPSCGALIKRLASSA